MAPENGPAGFKRPRLSLQIRPASVPTSTAGRPVDAGDSTAFNTLSNAYATAIEASSEPTTAINTLQACSLETPAEHKNAMPRVVTPYLGSYPETPLTAHSTSPCRLELHYPSIMTATPPLSAESADPASSNMFTFSSPDVSCARPGAGPPVEGPAPRRRPPPHLPAGPGPEPPYSHPRSLHSILRNSPLPPRIAIPPPSPRRQSLRLQEKAAKKVGYNSPLTQEITTNEYTKSHMELLAEDTSPSSPFLSPKGPLACATDKSPDSSPTPTASVIMSDGTAHPGLEASSSAGPESSRKRRRTEKRRRWVWTIGQDGDDDDASTSGAAEAGSGPAPTGPTPGPGGGETPTPSIESASPAAGSTDASSSGTCSVEWADDARLGLDAASETGLDASTPTAPGIPGSGAGRRQDTASTRDTPRDRDTPVPPELV